jgi:hypothetical protein
VCIADLSGRVFASLTTIDGGDVGAQTRFTYDQHGSLVSAGYEGGDIALGFLVGFRTLDRLDFRYCHLTVAGVTAGGHCVTQMRLDEAGRIVLDETWTWESRVGSGTSTLVEVG